jgi:hypothetical protein
MEKAVIDRFEGEYAILLVGQEQRKMDVLRSKLPKGAKEGSWVLIQIVDDDVANMVLDKEETELVRTRISDKLARLRRNEHRK